MTLDMSLMNVAVCKITLRLPENQSLKGKRRVINSICTRVRSKFNVSIGEVADNEAWQLATLGLSCVSNSSRHADEALRNVVSYIEESRLDLEVVGCEVESIAAL